MSYGSVLLQDLIRQLQILPGVGPKTAQRMAFYLLSRNRQGGNLLAEKLTLAMHDIGRCVRCQNFTEQEYCQLCQDPQRDERLLCIVETPADVAALEQSSSFKGRYFVLMGRLSPLDGIGPNELGLNKLNAILDGGIIQEVIIATNSTIEGEATAYYLSEMARECGIKASRIAQGVPMGGELEHLDENTIACAMRARSLIMAD